MAVIVYAKVKEVIIKTNIAQKYSSYVCGIISPYPTVTIVTIEK